jgi:hypothetical protein
MKKLWIIVCIAGLGLMARADSLDDDIKIFADTLKASEAAKPNANPDMGYRLTSVIAQLSAMDKMPGGEANVLGTVRQMMASYPAADVQKAGQALIDELEARKKTRDDAMKARVDEALARVPEILGKAQKTADLDGLLADLQKAQSGTGGYDPDSQPYTNRLTNAYQFVAQWQDYLSARSSGNNQVALETLRNLSNSQRNGDTFLPRSEILARLAELQKAAPVNSNSGMESPPSNDFTEVYDGIKSLDDLEPALKKLRSQSNMNMNPGAELATLSLYASLYEASRNGLPPSLQLAPDNYFNPTLPPQFERIKAMLLIYMLPRYIGAGAPAPNPNETVADYLARATDAAEGKQDWVSLQRIIEAETKIARVQQMPQGTHYFLAGLNQEMAGQYTQAVTSYQYALREADDFVPVKVVGDRLAAIKKDHPAEYEEGMKTPPTPMYNPAMMRAMMGYPLPGMNAAPGVNPTRPSIPPPTVPATTNIPSTTNSAPVAPAQ